MITARPLGTMIFDVPAGVLVGMIGLRRTMMAGILIFAIAAVIGGLSQNFNILVAGRFLAGISFALWSISRHVYIAQAVPVASRGKALSMFGGISRLATIIGPIIGGFLFEFVDIRAPFFAQAIVALMTAVLVLVTFRGTLEASAANARHNIFPVLGHTLNDHRRIFATAGMAAVMLQFLRAAREYIIPLWADELGLTGSQSGLIFGVSSTIDSVMFPVVGYVMDRWGRKYVGIPAYLILGGGFALIPLADSYALLMLVGILVGLGNGLSSGFVLTMGVDFAPKDNPGEFLGVWRFISDAGGASGPAAIGGIAALFALGTASVLTAGVGLAGTLILIFFVRETLVKEERPPPLR
jgi:MFS family permease